MLLLVAVNDKGHVPVGTDAFVNVGLTGALLAELALGGHLTIAGDGTVRAGDTRPGGELLADVHDAVREHLQGKKAKQVIGGLSRHIGGSRNRVADRLAGTGVLGRTRPSIWRPTQHPVIDTATHQAVLDQVAPDRGTRREAKKRIARATAETPFAPGVAQIVDQLIAGVAVTATSIAAS